MPNRYCRARKSSPPEKRALDHGPAFCPEHGHADIEQEDERAHDHDEIKRRRDLEQRPSLGPAEEETDERDNAGNDERNELDPGKFRRVDLALVSSGTI